MSLDMFMKAQVPNGFCLMDFKTRMSGLLLLEGAVEPFIHDEGVCEGIFPPVCGGKVFTL